MSFEGINSSFYFFNKMRFGLRSTEPAIEIWTKRLQHEPNQLVTKKKPISLAMKLKNKKWVVSRQGTGELIKKKGKKTHVMINDSAACRRRTS